MTQAFNLSLFANKLNASGQTDNTGLQNSSVTVTAGTGLSGGGLVALGSSITIANSGVTSASAGSGISVSASTGGITITNTAQGTPILGNTSQTYQNVTASRLNGTVYTNTTTAPIQVTIRGGDNGGQPLTLTITVNGTATAIDQLGFPAGGQGIWSIIVPVGQTYSATWNTSANFQQWWELR